MTDPVQLIPLGSGRHLDPEKLQWIGDENGIPFTTHLPLELREDLRFAFVVLPREIDAGSVPEPVRSLLQLAENHAVLDVTWRNQLAWLVAIHD